MQFGMRSAAFACFLSVSACGIASQPDSIRTVTAFAVPLTTPAEHDLLIDMMRRAAVPEGFVVESYSHDDLRRVSPPGTALRMEVTVWSNARDTEPVAGASEMSPNVEPAIADFARGSDPRRVIRFRDRLVSTVKRHWPNIQALPVLPNGTIPLMRDLKQTGAGYRIKPEAAASYSLPANSPLLAR